MPDPPSPFVLTTLGALRLDENGVPVKGGAAQRLRLVLLAILAASPRGISRDTLATLLWGERDEERARHSLEQALYGLKRSLGRDPVLRTSTALALDPSVVNADVATLDHAVAAEDWDSVARTYTGAYLDGVFLDEAPEFERWSERERARRREAYRRALEEKARAVEQQAPHEAIRWWRRLHDENPLSTRTVVGLTRALAAAGDTVEALRIAESHATAQQASGGRQSKREAAPELALLLTQLRGTDPAPEGKEAHRPLAKDVISVELATSLGSAYRIEGRVVRSRLYVAFRARQASTGRVVIVKVLEPSIVRADDRAVLCRHLERAVGLKHDHLASAHTLATTDHLVYLIGADDEGETLRDAVQRRGDLAVGEALAALRDIADALAHAHSAGVLHLDLTPKRIVLTPRGAMLRDTGIASALLGAANKSTGTEDTNLVLGTVAYMSPELTLARGAPNEQSDLFSLAAVFFQALTGVLPFGAAGAGAQARPQAPSAAAIRSTIPKAVDMALARALSPVRSDRHASVAAFLQELPTS